MKYFLFSLNIVFCCVVVVGIQYHLMKNEMKVFEQQLSDIQRSIGSYDSIIEPLSSIFGAKRITLFRVVQENASDIITSPNLLSVVVIDTIAHEGDTSAVLLSTRPLSTYSFMLPDLLDHKPFVSTTQNLPEGSLKELLLQRKNVFGVWIDVSDTQGNVVGILAAGWDNGDEYPQGQKLSDFLSAFRTISNEIGRNFNRLPTR